MAGYSSRGPTAIDYLAKPDLVAPGTGLVSLSDPTSTFYTTKAHLLLNGLVATSYKPYLSLSGTSMAAPVVTGTVALMLQANPNLTPNLVKAILQYTAQVYPGYDYLTQGAGFLNTRGAVTLARFFATAQHGERYPTAKPWSRHIIWGNHRLRGGVILPTAKAWDSGYVWGIEPAEAGENVVWGTQCDTLDPLCDNVVWGTDTEGSDTVVWGTQCDLNLDPICDTVVWGTLVDDNVVWGTDCAGADCDNVVWGASIDGLDDNVVWGTAEVVDNVVWGTSGEVDQVVWGTSSEEDNATWGNSGEDTPLFDDPDGDPAQFDTSVWDELFIAPTTEPAPTTTTTDTSATTTTDASTTTTTDTSATTDTTTTDVTSTATTTTVTSGGVL
jgi:hypothetical protein